MPYSLPLPGVPPNWKVKILDNELLEEPHATIVCKTRKWRYSLRQKCFMDNNPPGREVDGRVLEIIKIQMAKLHIEWNKIHGDINPV